MTSYNPIYNSHLDVPQLSIFLFQDEFIPSGIITSCVFISISS